jgi:hypothetical protein
MNDKPDSNLKSKYETDSARAEWMARPDRVADIERLTAWRHIAPEKQEQIALEFSPIAPSLDVLIEFQNGDPEAWSYAK